MNEKMTGSSVNTVILQHTILPVFGVTRKNVPRNKININFELLRNILHLTLETLQDLNPNFLALEEIARKSFRHTGI